jgi:hypothetical protein
MEPNLAVSIYVRSSIKFLHFVLFHQQIWPPRAILVSDWLLFKKIFSSETAWLNGAKLGRKHLCKILYEASSFGSIRPTNILKNSSHLEWRVGLSDTILKGTHPGTINARFGPYIDASCQGWLHLAKLFQRRRFFNISQSEKRINLGGHVC